MHKSSRLRTALGEWTEDEAPLVKVATLRMAAQDSWYEGRVQGSSPHFDQRDEEVSFELAPLYRLEKYKAAVSD